MEIHEKLKNINNPNIFTFHNYTNITIFDEEYTFLFSNITI